MTGSNTSEWNLRLLLFINGIFALSLLSWLLPPTADLWRQLDHSLYFLLNGSLEGNPDWQLFWGILNHKMEKRITPVLIAGLNIFYVFGSKDRNWFQRASLIIFFWVFMEALVISQNKFLRYGLDVNRHSPSLVLKPVILLSEVLSDPDIRDRSATSFPSGHALIHLFWAYFTYYVCGRRYGVIAFGIFGILALPRLFAGAHWFTDVYFGILLATLYMTWAVATPLSRWGSSKIESLLRFVFRRPRTPASQLAVAG